MAKTTTSPEDVAINADAFAPTPATGIPLAGLLNARPELRDAELPRAEWQELLDAFVTTHKTT